MGFAFTTDDLAPLSVDQKAAIMEALVVAVMADRQVVPAETARFDLEVEAIPWGLERATLIAQLTAARARVLGLANEAATLALIRDSGTRLLDPSLREKVFRAMGAIMFADQALGRGEINVLGKYATAFAIPHDRLDVIKADLDAAFGRGT